MFCNTRKTMPNTSLIFYSVSLAFILVHLYGWLIKWFYRPKAYADHFDQFFPAQRTVGLLYLLQIFEIPYLFSIGSSDALLYVNTFSLLLYSSLPMIMCNKYFYPGETPKWRLEKRN